MRKSLGNKRWVLGILLLSSVLPMSSMQASDGDSNVKQQPRMVELETKTLAGVSLDMSRVQDRTGQLWSSFMPRRTQIQNRVGEGYMSMQVYPDGPAQVSNPEAEFTKWAVVEVSSQDNLPEGMLPYTLEGGLYAVFVHNGPATDISTILYIFQEWLPSADFTLADREHFELLPEGYNPMDPNAREEFWIPVVAK